MPEAAKVSPAALSVEERSQLLERFGSHSRAIRGYAPRTATAYCAEARRFLDYVSEAFPSVDLGDISSRHLVEYLMHKERQGAAPATRRRATFALRRFFDFLQLFEVVEGNPAREVEPAQQTPQQTDVYTTAQACEILTCAEQDDSLHGRTLHAAMATLYYTGVRAGELVGIQLRDLDLAGRELRVLGKGGRERRIPVPAPLAVILTDYLDEVRPQLPGGEYLFSNPLGRGGSRDLGRFAPETLRRLVKASGRRAGVPGKHHPHRWRHTYATTMLRSGADLHTVQRLLGHATINQTVRYLHMLDDDLRNAVDHAFE